MIIDDWEAQEVYEQHLTAQLGHQFEFVCAPFGREGIRVARQIVPDLILIDLTFEELHGYDACKELRAHLATKNIPICLILNNGEQLPFDVQEFPTLRDRVIHRPFQMDQLNHFMGVL